MPIIKQIEPNGLDFTHPHAQLKPKFTVTVLPPKAKPLVEEIELDLPIVGMCTLDHVDFSSFDIEEMGDQLAHDQLVKGYVDPLDTFRNILIPMIRRILPSVIASELVDVQPMTEPSGTIHAIKPDYSHSVMGNTSPGIEPVRDPEYKAHRLKGKELNEFILDADVMSMYPGSISNTLSEVADKTLFIARSPGKSESLTILAAKNRAGKSVFVADDRTENGKYVFWKPEGATVTLRMLNDENLEERKQQIASHWVNAQDSGSMGAGAMAAKRTMQLLQPAESVISKTAPPVKNYPDLDEALRMVRELMKAMAEENDKRIAEREAKQLAMRNRIWAELEKTTLSNGENAADYFQKHMVGPPKGH